MMRNTDPVGPASKPSVKCVWQVQSQEIMTLPGRLGMIIVISSVRVDGN
jgi:hypothetical protein